MDVKDFKAGEAVLVDHPRYKGVGIAVGVIEEPMIAVRLENGNVWYYEARTVTPNECVVSSQDSTGRLRWCGRHNAPIGGRNVCRKIDPSQFT